MSQNREIKRVPLDFRWPLNTAWVGYTAQQPCPDCKACGNVNACKTCDGEMVIVVRTDPPDGPGYQLWSTMGAGSPASPVFAEQEKLLRWCAKNATFFARFGGTLDDWRKFAEGRTHMMDLFTGKIEWLPE